MKSGERVGDQSFRSAGFTLDSSFFSSPGLTLFPITSTVFALNQCNLETSMQEFETLKQLVAEAEPDVQKASGGNKAAGTRVRKKMQDIKAAAQKVRQKVLESREESEPGSPAAAAEAAEGGDA